MLLTASRSHCQWHQLYDNLSIYIVAHQDDWQLFMGSDAYNDMLNFDEKKPAQNGTRVVFIYTTAGNLSDSDDTRSCDCKDASNNYAPHFPYWKVREAGAKNSVHLAATRMGGWGFPTPYHTNETVTINGHNIAKYEFKNTVSYFLRIKAGMYERWYFDKHAQAGTMDSSTVYADWADFVNTLYYIYKAEMDSSIVNNKISFHCPDLDTTINPKDHGDHLLAGRAGSEAAKLLGADLQSCFPQLLYVDYHSQDLSPNLSADDMQNKAALTGAYCLALLNHNAWPEWGQLYRDWSSRNYYRTITTCQDATSENILADDALINLTVTAFPGPANQVLNLRFNLPVKSLLQLKIIDVNGAQIAETDTTLSNENTVSLNVGSLPNGSYLLFVGKDGSKLSSVKFEVMH